MAISFLQQFRTSYMYLTFFARVCHAALMPRIHFLQIVVLYSKAWRAKISFRFIVLQQFFYRNKIDVSHKNLSYQIHFLVRLQEDRKIYVPCKVCTISLYFGQRKVQILVATPFNVKFVCTNFAQCIYFCDASVCLACVMRSQDTRISILRFLLRPSTGQVSQKTTWYVFNEKHSKVSLNPTFPLITPTQFYTNPNVYKYMYIYTHVCTHI
eukprot:TRINITY_DN23846_c0_g1_i1.p1 TRINITY_DN23846_c0_g1~~TRINITY_DN23846_c0_g1_i1.p1  ORF type:complete len:211 (+),score=-21.52 TRINITY_DN23846_c0_g1_i1:164-796(+)